MELRRNYVIVLANPVPNSIAFSRPVTLSRATEVREILKVELEPSLEILRQYFNVTTDVDGKTVPIKCTTECSMNNGKMVSFLQGDSGAFCHLCHSTRTKVMT